MNLILYTTYGIEMRYCNVCVFMRASSCLQMLKYVRMCIDYCVYTFVHMCV